MPYDNLGLAGALAHAMRRKREQGEFNEQKLQAALDRRQANQERGEDRETAKRQAAISEAMANLQLSNAKQSNWGAPIEVEGPDGQSRFIQIDQRGNQRDAPFTPAQAYGAPGRFRRPGADGTPQDVYGSAGSRGGFREMAPGLTPITGQKPWEAMDMTEDQYYRHGGRMAGLQARASGGGAGGGGLTNEVKIYNEFESATKPHKVRAEAFGTILASANDPSPAGDLSLIFSYMKVLDPGSTVREGEYAEARNSAGIPERVRAIYNNALNGEKVSAATRQDFLGRSIMLIQASMQEFDGIRKHWDGVAAANGVDPSRATYDWFAPYRQRIGEQPAAPSPGPGLTGAMRGQQAQDAEYLNSLFGPGRRP